MANVITIDSNNFDKLVLDSKANVVVDFYATWCGPCKQLAPIIDKLAAETEDVLFFKIDIDQNPDIAAKYGIISIPTLISFKDGEKADTMVGGGNVAQIKQQLSSVL